MAVAKNRQNKRSNALVITEALLVSYIGYITSFSLVQLNLISEPDVESLTINIFLITLSVLLCSLSVGLYEAKLRETFRGIIRRIFVSLGLSYFIVEILAVAHEVARSYKDYRFWEQKYVLVEFMRTVS